jgi:hypothetical protein
VPTKGLALPFFSYGGTAMVANFICLGLIMTWPPKEDELKGGSSKRFKLLVAGAAPAPFIPGRGHCEEFKNRIAETKSFSCAPDGRWKAEILTSGAFAQINRSAVSMAKAFLSNPFPYFPTLAFSIHGHHPSFKPDLVFGVGGYVTGPIVWRRVYSVIQRHHEQKSLPGLANRLLGRLAIWFLSV